MLNQSTIDIFIKKDFWMIPDCVEKDGSHHPEVIAGNSSVTMIAAKIEQKFFGLKKMCFLLLLEIV
jgi:hypothetical protein